MGERCTQLRSICLRLALCLTLCLTLYVAPGLQMPAFAADPGPTDGSAEARVWYQVEVVLFAQEGAHAPTAEQVRDDVMPIWPPGIAALGPVHPEPVRPSSMEELAMQRDADYVRPLRRMPDLTPEDEALIAWLRRETTRSRSSGLEWQADLETLARTAPDPQPEQTPAQALNETGTDTPAADSSSVDASEADDPAADDADDAGMDDLADDEDGILIPVSLAFRSVAPELRHLNDEVRRLERARGVRVLRHLAWRQPFAQEAPGIPVQVLWQDPDDGQPALLGVVAIDLRRFLHANLDLYWRVRGPEGESVWTRVLENRRMRSGELHYVDHPQVGALIRIERFALGEPLAADAQVVPLREED